MKPVLDHRVGKTKWVVLRWPSPAMAQQAGISTEAFEEFYFKVCTLDYARLTPGMNASVHTAWETRPGTAGPSWVRASIAMA